uniref:Na+/H+ antiporter NhaC family protein n=1 Tax=Nocardioides sp. TaxID=35761 RepID=UPI002B2714D2
LAGAVAGDHASPISDTTILSSTGAGCNVITHVTTQLPYVLIAVVSAALGYVAVALIGSVALGAAVTLVVAGAIAFVALQIWGSSVTDEELAEHTKQPA